MKLKLKLKTWSIRIAASAILSVISIIGTLLNPGLLYAKKTEIGNYTVYHNKDLSHSFESRLNSINKILKESELFGKDLKIDLCLNDGSYYPTILKTVFPPAFGWSISNKAVFQGKANYEQNFVELNGYKWNLEQLFAHEITHCLQYNYLGPFKINPIIRPPNWKVEGYAEYISRKNPGQLSLHNNIERIQKLREKDEIDWGIFFDDNTVTPRIYYDYWLLVQYCLDVKKMTYAQLLDSEIERTSLEEEMQSWYIQKTKM